MGPTRLILLEPSGRKHLVVLDRETVTLPRLGVVRAETLVASIGKRWTVGGRSFLVLTPSIRDTVGLLGRKAQIIGPKDLPALVWNSDVKPGDFIVEVGAGSGALTVVLANAVGPKGRVVSYDLRPEFLDVAQRNVSAAGLEERVEFKVGDARVGIPGTGADAFVVDIPDPWETIGNAASALRPGPFVEIRTLGVIEREIEASGAGTRPSFAPLGHTGYLSFARKVLDTF